MMDHPTELLSEKLVPMPSTDDRHINMFELVHDSLVIMYALNAQASMFAFPSIGFGDFYGRCGIGTCDSKLDSDMVERVISFD